MIIEVGHFALILACIFSALQMRASLSVRSAVITFSLILIAFLSLVYAFITTDLSVAIVAENSHSLKPMLYKIAGTWGNHEGSILLWCLMLAFFGFLITRRQSHDKELTIKTLQVHGALTLGFILYTLTVSSPFARLVMPPLDGQGLTPVLQDPALSFHPPLLYLGYVGFSVAFSYALAGLWRGTIDARWVKTCKPWVILAWTSLSAGIALGSWWAYYELGWGGWWFWDPVENASLMPWLIGTALLHSVLVVEKRDSLKKWTILLAILTFSLSMLGTFLVRSGVLTSVHAFAVDPKRGIFILGLLVLYTGTALTLFAMRASKLSNSSYIAPLSREGLLLLNNLFLVTATVTILVGTLYPLILSALNLAQLSVGPPYFYATVVPILAPMVIIMALGPLVPWKKSDVKALWPQMKTAVLGVILICIALSFGSAPRPFASTFGLALAAWLIFASITKFVQSAGIRRSDSDFLSIKKRILKMDKSEAGSIIAHLGLGVAIIGMVGSGLWVTEHKAVVSRGGQFEVGNYIIKLEDIKPVFGENYSAIEATIDLQKKTRNMRKTTLHPQKRYYPVADDSTKEIGIYKNFSDDVYVVLGDKMQDDNGKTQWAIHAWVHPMIQFLWYGFALITIGGILSFAGAYNDKK